MGSNISTQTNELINCIDPTYNKWMYDAQNSIRIETIINNTPINLIFNTNEAIHFEYIFRDILKFNNNNYNNLQNYITKYYSIYNNPNDKTKLICNSTILHLLCGHINIMFEKNIISQLYYHDMINKNIYMKKIINILDNLINVNNINIINNKNMSAMHLLLIKYDNYNNYYSLENTYFDIVIDIIKLFTKYKFDFSLFNTNSDNFLTFFLNNVQLHNHNNEDKYLEILKIIILLGDNFNIECLYNYYNDTRINIITKLVRNIYPNKICSFIDTIIHNLINNPNNIEIIINLSNENLLHDDIRLSREIHCVTLEYVKNCIINSEYYKINELSFNELLNFMSYLIYYYNSDLDNTNLNILNMALTIYNIINNIKITNTNTKKGITINNIFLLNKFLINIINKYQGNIYNNDIFNNNILGNNTFKTIICKIKNFININPSNFLEIFNNEISKIHKDQDIMGFFVITYLFDKIKYPNTKTIIFDHIISIILEASRYVNLYNIKIMIKIISNIILKLKNNGMDYNAIYKGNIFTTQLLLKFLDFKIKSSIIFQKLPNEKNKIESMPIDYIFLEYILCSLIKNGLNISNKNFEMDTTLHTLIKLKKINKYIYMIFLNLGFNINELNNKKLTILHYENNIDNIETIMKYKKMDFIENEIPLLEYIICKNLIAYINEYLNLNHTNKFNICENLFEICKILTRNGFNVIKQYDMKKLIDIIIDDYVDFKYFKSIKTISENFISHSNILSLLTDENLEINCYFETKFYEFKINLLKLIINYNKNLFQFTDCNNNTLLHYIYKTDLNKSQKTWRWDFEQLQYFYKWVGYTGNIISTEERQWKLCLSLIELGSNYYIFNNSNENILINKLFNNPLAIISDDIIKDLFKNLCDHYKNTDIFVDICKKCFTNEHIFLLGYLYNNKYINELIYIKSLKNIIINDPLTIIKYNHIKILFKHLYNLHKDNFKENIFRNIYKKCCHYGHIILLEYLYDNKYIDEILCIKSIDNIIMSLQNNNINPLKYNRDSNFYDDGETELCIFSDNLIPSLINIIISLNKNASYDPINILCLILNDNMIYATIITNIHWEYPELIIHKNIIDIIKIFKYVININAHTNGYNILHYIMKNIVFIKDKYLTKMNEVKNEIISYYGDKNDNKMRKEISMVIEFYNNITYEAMEKFYQLTKNILKLKIDVNSLNLLNNNLLKKEANIKFNLKGSLLHEIIPYIDDYYCYEIVMIFINSGFNITCIDHDNQTIIDILAKINSENSKRFIKFLFKTDKTRNLIANNITSKTSTMSLAYSNNNYSFIKIMLKNKITLNNDIHFFKQTHNFQHFDNIINIFLDVNYDFSNDIENIKILNIDNSIFLDIIKNNEKIFFNTCDICFNDKMSIQCNYGHNICFNCFKQLDNKCEFCHNS